MIVLYLKNSFIFDLSNTHKHRIMKNYTVTIEIKSSNFYNNNFESFTIGADNRKDAIQKGRRIARQENAKFIDVRLVRN